MSDASKTEFNEQIRQDEPMDFQTKFNLLHQTLDEQRRLLQKVRILGKDAWKDEPLPKKKMGEVSEEVFLTESPAIAADALARIACASGING